MFSVLKMLRGAPYKQPPSRPLSPLHDDNNDGNYAHMMDTLKSNCVQESLQIAANSQTNIHVKTTITYDVPFMQASLM